MLWYRLRIIFTLLIVQLVSGGILSYILIQDYEERLNIYHVQVTAAIDRAITNTLYDATRTAEAPHNRYQLIMLNTETSLEAAASIYKTTPELIRMVNGLAPQVTHGDGEAIIMPTGIDHLEPMRRIEVYRAQANDTLESIATLRNVSADLLKEDNPVLAQRGLRAGDIVFIGIQF